MDKEEKIRPSLLASDYLHIGRDINQIIKLGLKTVHFDVMDGSFVDDITFGEPLFRTLSSKYRGKISFDVHLMVDTPFKHVRSFYEAGAREISFHYENTKGSVDKIAQIREEYPDLKLGLAISPETPVSLVYGLSNLFDYYLIMSVVPGKGGQKFIEGSQEKVRLLSEFRRINNLNFYIGIDGGIDAKRAKELFAIGCDYTVIGSSFFKAEDKESFIKEALE